MSAPLSSIDVELSAIVPLPAAVADNRAAAFVALAGDAPLARVVRTMLGPAAAAPDRRRDRQAADRRGPRMPCGARIVVGGGRGRRRGRSAPMYRRGAGIPCRRVDLDTVRTRSRLPASAGAGRRMRPGGGAAARGSAVVFPALPLTDSVKAVDSRGRVIGTVDRSTLPTAQYPRGFTGIGWRSWWRRARRMFSTKSRRRFAPALQITVVDGDPDAVRRRRATRRVNSLRPSSRRVRPSAAEQQAFGDQHVAGVGHLEVARVARNVWTSTSVNRSIHDDVSVPSKPSRSAAR